MAPPETAGHARPSGLRSWPTDAWLKGFGLTCSNASMKPSPKLFQNLGNTRETELADPFPIQLREGALMNAFLKSTPDFSRASKLGM